MAVLGADRCQSSSAFFLSNLLKFDDGGWLPIAVAVLRLYPDDARGRKARRTLNWLIAKEQMPVRDFLAMIESEPPHRVAGTAVYLASEAGGIPRALLNNLRFNRVLHERNVLLTFVRPEVPFVRAENRVEMQMLGDRLVPRHRALRLHGNTERRRRAARRRGSGVPYEPEQTVYVVGRENPVFAVGSGMPLWRKRLFAFMGRNSQLAAIHFGVPTHRLLEVSSQVRL